MSWFIQEEEEDRSIMGYKSTACPCCGNASVMLEIGTGRVIGCGPCDFHIPTFPYKRTSTKIGRNDLCPCGSRKKYKKCCINN